MGSYWAMGPIVRKTAEDINRRENLWRAQEAKILKVLNLCAVIKRDDNHAFAVAMDRVCARLEQNPDMQSLLIRETLKDVITGAGIPAIAGRAAACYAAATWDKCADDEDAHKVVTMTYDHEIVRSQDDSARSAQAEIVFHAPFVSSTDPALRAAAITTLTKYAAHPAGAQSLRDIFSAAAEDESLPEPARQEISAGLENVVRVQEAAITALAADIASHAPAVRPRLIRP